MTSSSSWPWMILHRGNAGSVVIWMLPGRIYQVLKQRIVTAIMLVVALIALTTFLSPFYYALLLTPVVLIAAWEWGGFIGLDSREARTSYCVTIALMLVGLFILLGIRPTATELDATRVVTLLLLGLMFWSFSLVVLWGYPGNRNLWNDPSRIATMGIFSLLPTWIGLVQLKYLQTDGYYLLALIGLVAAVDIGAFFIGSYFGRRKLAPDLSPKKSWEGVWGGLIACVLVGSGLIWLLHSHMLNLSATQFFILFMLTGLVTVLSVVGDLLESMLKRNQSIKDSGAILPGHGGILDRIDGLMAATPVYVLLIMLMLRSGAIA